MQLRSSALDESDTGGIGDTATTARQAEQNGARGLLAPVAPSKFRFDRNLRDGILALLQSQDDRGSGSSSVFPGLGDLDDCLPHSRDVPLYPYPGGPGGPGDGHATQSPVNFRDFDLDEVKSRPWIRPVPAIRLSRAHLL